MLNSWNFALLRSGLLFLEATLIAVDRGGRRLRRHALDADWLEGEQGEWAHWPRGLNRAARRQRACRLPSMSQPRPGRGRAVTRPRRIFGEQPAAVRPAWPASAASTASSVTTMTAAAAAVRRKALQGTPSGAAMRRDATSATSRGAGAAHGVRGRLLTDRIVECAAGLAVASPWRRGTRKEAKRTNSEPPCRHAAVEER